jgi:hypothetical protein
MGSTYYLETGYIVEWTETRRTVAKQLFGRPVRVALAQWVLERDFEPFFLLEAQRSLDAAVGGSGSAVGHEVNLMCSMGMLDRVPDGRRVYFVARVDSPFWPAFAAIGAALRALEADHEVDRALRHGAGST